MAQSLRHKRLLTIIAPQKSTNNSPITRSKTKLLPPRDTHTTPPQRRLAGVTKLMQCAHIDFPTMIAFMSTCCCCCCCCCWRINTDRPLVWVNQGEEVDEKLKVYGFDPCTNHAIKWTLVMNQRGFHRT